MYPHKFIKILFGNPILLILLGTVFSILYQGYYFGGPDQVFYIPYLKALKDTSLYPNDIFISTWKAVYFGNLWKALAFALNFLPMQPLLFVLHIIFRFLFFFAVYLLSLEIFKKKSVAYLSVVLWFIPKPSLGFEIFYNEFVQAGVVLPILLFSMLFFLKNKYLLSFILLGLSFHIHPPMSGFVLLPYAFYFLYKKEFRNLLFLFTVVTIFAFPVIISTLGFTSGKGGYGREWLELTKIRSPHHSFPFSWPKEKFFPFLLFFTLFLLTFKNSFRKINSIIRSKIYFIVFSFILIMLSGLIFSEIIPVPKFIVTVPFHVSSIFAVFASFSVIFFIYLLVADKLTTKRFLGYSFFIFFFFNNFNFNFQKSEFLVLTLVFIVSLLIYKFYKRDHNRRAILYFQIFIFILTIFWLPVMIKKNMERKNDRENNWIAMQRWANKNTAKNASFIVPIYEPGFRLYSERTIVGDWKDGSAGYLSPYYLHLWWLRMQDFGLTTTSYSDSFQAKSYFNLSADKVKYIGQKYKANFFIAESKKTYPFRVLHKNKDFILYKL